MLVVWHNFSKNQRDKTIVQCTEILFDLSNDLQLNNKVPLCCYRLLLILDYFIHQHDTLPKDLITQVQYNLFKPKLAMPFAYMDDETMMEQRLLFFQNFERGERDYHRACKENNEGEFSFQKRTPRFYGIRPCDDNQSVLDKEAVM